MNNALYIHIPFCRSKCAYCDFFSVPVDKSDGIMTCYVTALRREAQLRGRGSAETVFMGGGTPSVLPEGSIQTILECASEHTHIVSGAEITVEANPESITSDFIDEIRRAGVTRLSMGVQSMQDSELRTLGRPHTSEMAINALQRARRNADNLEISLDLMYGIPGQNLHSWQKTLTEAIRQRPDHISAYELTLEEDTAMMAAVKKGELTMPSDDEISDMYHLTQSTLDKAGYEQYEVSNYALNGRQCRHNINYWRRGQYLGLGPGAVSFDGKTRTKNLPDLTLYIKALEAGELPPMQSETLSPLEAAREFLLLGMRQTEGVSLEQAARQYGLGELAEASGDYIDEGLMEITGQGFIRMTKKGMPLI